MREIVKNCNDKVVWVACDAPVLEKSVPNVPAWQSKLKAISLFKLNVAKERMAYKLASCMHTFCKHEGPALYMLLGYGRLETWRRVFTESDYFGTRVACTDTHIKS